MKTVSSDVVAEWELLFAVLSELVSFYGTILNLRRLTS